MKGMESMVASMLGVNPQELKEQFEGKVLEFQKYAADLQAQLTRIEQNQILLYRLMVHAGVIPTLENMRAQQAQTLEAPDHARERVPS